MLRPGDILVARSRGMALLGIALVFAGRCRSLPAGPGDAAGATGVRTVAEASEFRATGRYRDVLDFAARLAERSPRVRLLSLGSSVEGRSLPLLVVGDPPVEAPRDAESSGRLIVLLMGAIHGGEVCGKEALLMLARDLALAETPETRDILARVVVAMAPLVNPDGNERISRDNRPHQNGPEEGAGIRENARGLDLNRDFVKLEAPETRALVRFLREWDPALVVDTHTTNGSYHRYALTYTGPRHPAVPQEIARYVGETMLPALSRRLWEEEEGLATFRYGNFTDGHRAWRSYPALPRYGTPYRGLRGRLALITEAYAYAPFAERVRATYGFLRAALEHVARETPQLRRLLDEARKASRGDLVAIRTRAVPCGERVTVAGYEERREGDRVLPGEPRDYEVDLVDCFEAERSVRRPFAYLLPPELAAVRETLAEHGVELEVLREDLELDVEGYRVDSMCRAAEPFQGHRLLALEVTSAPERVRIDAGTIVVRADQALGTLAVCLLEPESEDGLAAWNFLDDDLETGRNYPLWRLLEPFPLRTAPLEPAAARRQKLGGGRRPVTFDVLYGSAEPPRFGGSPASGQEWLEDGEHWLEVRKGKRWKVHARSGRVEPLGDPEAVAAALKALPGMDAEAAGRIARDPALLLNPARTALLVDHADDLYHVAPDGGSARRLTTTPAREELCSFSPDGKLVAFVRDNDLWVVEVTGGRERALTTGGSERLRRGKADWVYFEEVFHRRWRTYWWSPRSDALLFLEIDSRAVAGYTLVNDLPRDQEIEVTPYPLAGGLNPKVRAGVVPAAGGPVRWADLSRYSPGNFLVTGAGWQPGGERAYLLVQDRAQTWLDLCSLEPRNGEVRALLRDRTQAWVAPPESSPLFLRDGSFLLESERTGYRHVYHFAADGELKRQLTAGEWAVARIEGLDEGAGWVYFSATRDSPVAADLYRVSLAGSGPERLTHARGSHRVNVAPGGRYFVDLWSSRQAPPRVALFRADGVPLRTLDTNPVSALEEYRYLCPEPVAIAAADGFELQATILRPRGFDASRRYPVWLMTYGGPQAQTVWDSWGHSGGAWDQLLAQSGVVVCRCDPRTATSRGAVHSWRAYRQLGVVELEDLEAVVRWLRRQPWVDPGRIGLSGHSYGGFLTAYALTHSDLFAAGIAGSPVTDWHDYDTIYTERYMGMPQDNPEGYRATSVVAAAGNLHGCLLLLHGARDDNVHLANTLRLVDALQKAGKQFELMLYPRARHGIRGEHYHRLMYEFILRTVGGGEAQEPVPAPAASEGGGRRRHRVTF